MPEEKKVSALYKDTIKQLEAISADPETDDRFSIRHADTGTDRKTSGQTAFFSLPDFDL